MDKDWYQLPDGSEINIPSDYSREQLTALFDDLSEEFPDSIGSAWNSYGDKDEEDKGNIFGALYQGIENIPRGAASVPLLMAQGIACVLTPHKDTEIEKKLRGARDWLYSGIDPKYTTSKIANIGMGLGQLAPIIAASRFLAPMATFAPALVARHGAQIMSKLSPAARQTLMASSQGIAAGSMVSVPMMMGDAATRIADYEERTGEDVSALKELAAFGISAPVGVLETLPIVGLGKIPGFASKAAAKTATLEGAGLALPKLSSSFLMGATTEALQESTSEFLQTSAARALYDDEAYERLGERVSDAGVVGGGAGGIAAVLMNLFMRRKGGAALGMQVQTAAQIERDNIRKHGRKDAPSDTNLEIDQEAVDRGFGLANPRFTEDEYGVEYNKRYELHLDQLIKEEAELAKETTDGPSPTQRTETMPDGTPVRQIDVDFDTREFEGTDGAKDGAHVPVGLEAGQKVTIFDIAGNIVSVEVSAKSKSGTVKFRLPDGNEVLLGGPEGYVWDNINNPKYVFKSAGKLGVQGKTLAELSKSELEEMLPKLEAIYQIGKKGGRGATTTRNDALQDINAIKKALQRTDSPGHQAKTPEELESEATVRVEEDRLRDTERFNESQRNKEEVELEAGLPFLDLDEVGGMPIEELTAMVETGRLSPEAFEKILISDRLSKSGGESRNELKDFAERNAQPNNTFSAGAVATAILGSDPVLVKGMKSSEDMFGSGTIEEQMQRAIEMLTPMLSPETAAILSQRYLNPSQVNQIVDEARASINQGRKGNQFRVKDAYNMLFGFRGGVDMYDRVQRTYKKKGVTWTQNTQGDLELTFADTQEVEVVDMIRGMTADQIWNNKIGFKKAVLKFLKKKNITLPARAAMGDGGQLDSDAFKAIVRSVTGKNSLQEITQPGQRKAIMGRLVHLPTLKKATPLVDLSRRNYTPGDVQTVVTSLNAKPNQNLETLAQTVISEQGVQNINDLRQIMRHLQQGGYVTVQGKNKFSLTPENRAHARTPQDAMRDDYRQELEQKEKAETLRNQTLLSKILDIKVTLSNVSVASGLDSAGVELQLAADLDPIYESVVNPDTGIIKNPEFIKDAAIKLDGPNARIFVNLSKVDPDGTRPIADIIQDFKKEVWAAYDFYQYIYESEHRSIDGRAREDVLPKEIWEEYSPDPYSEGNFLEFAAKINPNGTKGDVIADARAMYMEALSKGLIDPQKTAGQVGSLKKRLLNLITGAVTVSRKTGIQDVMSIYSQFESGEIGRRGPGLSVLDPEGSLRNLQIQDYVNPKHFEALQKAMTDNDVEAKERILAQIVNEEQSDIALADVPERSWQDTLENKLSAQEELESTKPGEIPSLGINASDNALEAFFALRRGDQPYRMPEPIKNKYRRKIKWTPTKDLQDLAEMYADPDTKADIDQRLTSELVLETLASLQGDTYGVDAEGNVKKWGDLSEAQKFKKTKAVYEENSISWVQPFKALVDPKERAATMAYARRMILDAAYPAELQEQMFARAANNVGLNIRRLADTSAVAMIRFRNSAMNPAYTVQMEGGIFWTGSLLKGVHQAIKYGDEQMTPFQFYGLLETAQDRKYATLAGAAQKKIDQEGHKAEAQITYDRVVSEAEAKGLTKEEISRESNIRFFKKQLKSRPWGDESLTPEEQLVNAETILAKIKLEAPHVIEFLDQFQKHNKRTNLPWLLKLGMITQEIHDYLQEMSYVPLYKNIGMVSSYPLGSNGRARGRMSSKVLAFGRMKEADGFIFDHALDSFNDLDKVDIIESIMYSNTAMIRDGLSNVAGLRVVDTAQKLTDLGLGTQLRRVYEDGPDVLRVMRDGQEEYWQMADPDLTNATMLLGFNASDGIIGKMFEVAKISSRMLRFGIINFPVFIYRNFYKDSDNRTVTFSGSEPSFLPVIESLRKATESGLLERGRMNMLVSGGGGAFYDVADLISGIGPAGAFFSKLGEKIGMETSVGARKAKESRTQDRYEKVLRNLESGQKIEFTSLSDYASFIEVAYRNLKDLGEVTARMSAHDITLGRTGNAAQAMLDGLEIMNYGRRGGSPLLNAITSMIPFMSGGITGLDTWWRAHSGAPDAPGAHLINPAMTDEAAKQIRNRTLIRGAHLMGTLLVYYMLMRDDEKYKRMGEVEKMNNFIIPVGDKYFKLPIAFTTGMLYKAIPESILRAIDEDDYTAADVGSEVLDQLGRNLDFHAMPQIMRPLYDAMKNHNSFTNEAIVPSFMEDLPPEMQRTDYTSNTATALAKVFGVFPGPHPFSSPQKMEYMIRQYTGYAGLYSMMVGDRLTREVTGQNIVGTRYDWGPASLLNGQGIENFPVLGDLLGDGRLGNASVEKFYELQDDVNIYMSVLNKLDKERKPEELQKYLRDNLDVGHYRRKVRAFGKYMTRWRERRDRVLQHPSFTDEQKRSILFDMIEERDAALDGLTDVDTDNWERPSLGISDVSAGMRGIK